MEIKFTEIQKKYLSTIAWVLMIQFLVLSFSSIVIKYIFEDYTEHILLKVTKISLQFNLQLLSLFIQLIYFYIINKFRLYKKDMVILNKNVDLRQPEYLH